MRPLTIMCSVILFLVFSPSIPGRISAADTYQEMINCDLHAGPCSQSFSENTITLEVTPRPVKAMQNLSFRVTLSGNQLPPAMAPYIDLGMPGMNMGPNRVQLKSAGNNSFEGQGVIVKCPSGRRSWQATVTIPDVGRAEFIFDVLY